MAINTKPIKERKYNPKIDLTDAQEDFCQQYVGKAKHNASEAYMLAYPKSAKWGENALNVQACRYMAKPKISLRIAALEAETGKRNEISIDYVLKNLKEIGEACKTIRKSGRMDSGGANKSFELIGKHLGMFVERHKVEADVTVKVVERFGEEEK